MPWRFVVIGMMHTDAYTHTDRAVRYSPTVGLGFFLFSFIPRSSVISGIVTLLVPLFSPVRSVHPPSLLSSTCRYSVTFFQTTKRPNTYIITRRFQMPRETRVSAVNFSLFLISFSSYFRLNRANISRLLRPLVILNVRVSIHSVSLRYICSRHE